MSPTSTNNNQQTPTTANSINVVAAEVISLTPLEIAFEAFKNNVYTGLNITQIGLLVQINKIKCDLNRTFLLDSKAAYFNKLATATNSTPYQGRKE